MARSPNDGVTWQSIRNPFFAEFDGPGLAIDGRGALYATNIGAAYVEVFRSDDLGRSWRGTTPLSTVSPVDASPFVDRPWIAARGDGEVMLVFYDVGRSLQEACVRTTNAGASWLDRDPLFGPPVAGRPVFGSDGTFAYTTTEGDLRLYAGTDATGSRCRASPTVKPLFEGILGDRTMLDTDSVDGAYYSTVPDTGNSDILLGGWRPEGGPSGTRKVIDVAPPVLRGNAMPTVSAHGDEIAVAWYATETGGDFQQSEFTGSWNVFVARVHGFWSEAPTIELIRLTTQPNHVGSVCLTGIACTTGDRDLLDYLGLDHDRLGGLHAAYTHDGATTESYVRYARVS